MPRYFAAKTLEQPQNETNADVLQRRQSSLIQCKTDLSVMHEFNEMVLAGTDTLVTTLII